MWIAFGDALLGLTNPVVLHDNELRTGIPLAGAVRM